MGWERQWSADAHKVASLRGIMAHWQLWEGVCPPLRLLLAAEGGAGGGGGGVDVGGIDEAPPGFAAVGLVAVHDRAAVIDAGEVEGADVHDGFEAVEFLACQVDVLAVGIQRHLEAAWPGEGCAPDEIGEIGEAGSDPGGFPVDGDGSVFGQEGVIGVVEEVAVEQGFGEAGAIVGGAHLVAEVLESFAVGGGDPGGDGIEEGEGGEEILPWVTGAGGIVASGATGAGDGIVRFQGVEEAVEIAHHAQFFDTGREWLPVDECGDEDGGVVESGDRGVNGGALGRVLLAFEVFEDGGVALDGGPATGGWEDAGNPGVAIVAIDAEDVVVVLAGLCGGAHGDAVVVLEVGDQAIGDGFVVEAGLDVFEISTLR